MRKTVATNDAAAGNSLTSSIVDADPVDGRFDAGHSDLSFDSQSDNFTLTSVTDDQSPQDQSVIANVVPADVTVSSLGDVNKVSSASVDVASDDHGTSSRAFEHNRGSSSGNLNTTAPNFGTESHAAGGNASNAVNSPVGSDVSIAHDNSVSSHTDGLAFVLPDHSAAAIDFGPLPEISAVASTSSSAGDEMQWILVGGDAGSTTTTTGTSTGTSTTTAGGSASAGLIINVNYDASVNSAPAAFKTNIAAAVSYLESKFSDPITITINVGYGEVNGQTMGSGALGQSMYYIGAFNYTQVKNALAADATTANDASSVASLPGTDPTNGGTFYVASAEAKALGLWAGTIPDGWVGLSSSAGFDYNNADGVSAGTYDFYGTALHEISEVLGRELSGGQNGTYNPLDLFHYSAPGVRTLSGSTPGYFSVNNGQTNLNTFNTNPGGDFGDWAGATPDAGNAYGTPGVVSPFSAADLAALDAIGWNLVSSGPGAPVISGYSPDTGVTGDGVTKANTLTLTGTAVASSTVNVYDGATLLGTATANSSGAWTFTTGTLGNGTHSFTATDTVSGVTSGASTALSVTVDTVAPVAPSIASFSTDSGVVGDKITNDNTLTLAGTAEANATVKVYDGATLLGSAIANGAGAWSFTTAALADGAHSLNATATDAAGNTGVASTALGVTVDTVAPTVPSIATEAIVNTNQIALTGAAEANSTVKIYDGATLLGSTTASAGGAWNYTTAALSSGTHNLTETATDVAGNTGAASSVLPVAISAGGTVIESLGTTSLVNSGNHFYFDSISTGTGPSLKYGGADFVAGQFGGWTPIATEQTTSGYEVAWKYVGSDLYTVWNTDSNGNYVSSAVAPGSGSNSAFEAIETSFHQDLNGDGVIGLPQLPTTVIESVGSSSLVEVGTNFFLDNTGTATGPSLKYGGADFVAGQFGGWTPIATEQTTSGYEVAWKYVGSDLYTVWNTDSNGNYVSSAVAPGSGSNATFEAIETSFHQDLNGDGVIGLPPLPTTVIESLGATSLVNSGNHFYIDSISTGTGPSLKYGGADFVAGQFGGWTPIAAEQTTSGYEVAWKYTGSDLYTVWNTDSNGNYVSSAVAPGSGSNSAFEAIETSFHQDLNGDGVIGLPQLPTTVIESVGSSSLVEVGTNFFLDNTGTATGPSLKYGGADFVAGQFGGWTPIATEQTTSGYEVAWKYVGSDLYTVWNTDSNGNYVSSAVAPGSGSNTAFEASETGFVQDLNGNGLIGGKTIVNGAGGNDTFTSSSANEVFFGNGGSNTFVFSGLTGNDVIADFHASSDAVQLSKNAFATFADVLSHAAQVGSDVTITIDAADSVTLHNTVVAQLTSTNFHLV